MSKMKALCNQSNLILLSLQLVLTAYVFFLQILQQQAAPLKMADAATEVDTKAALATAANEARGLAMDSIAAAHSGHMGLPLGCAEIGAVLYGSQVSIKCNNYSFLYLVFACF